MCARETLAMLVFAVMRRTMRRVSDVIAQKIGAEEYL
jgi:hypothetical protein